MGLGEDVETQRSVDVENPNIGGHRNGVALKDRYLNSLEKSVLTYAQVIDAWHSLPPDTRTATLAIVEAAQGR